MTTRVLLLSLVISLAGCYLPVSASAPIGPATLGAKTFGMGFSVEYPALDALETTTGVPDASAPNRYPTSPVPAFDVFMGGGLSHTTDLEVGVQGGLYSILPVPHGAWIGLRRFSFYGPSFDLGWSMRAGYLGLIAKRNEPPNEGATVQVVYGSFTGSVRFNTWRQARPGLALTLQPMGAIPFIRGVQADNLYGLVVSTTLSIEMPWAIPFMTTGIVYSDNVRGLAPVFTFGLAKRL